MKSVNQTSRGTYVVTYDVDSRLQAFRSGNLKVPNQNDPIFRNFHRLLLEKMRVALPDVNIHTIGMSKVRVKIWKEVETRIKDMHNQVVLSTCQEIADSNPKSEGLVLNINRLFNTNGEKIGHGPRPGFNSLSEQFKELEKVIAGRSVVLIEDGAFSGGTLRFVLNQLNEMGLNVTALVVGFCCTRAHSVLKEVFPGELVIVDPLDNLVDWIPDHDLIPFIPNCGRVLGESLSSGYTPVQTVTGASCAYPYILPFGNMEKWATLPTESARDLSQFCLDTSIEIFEQVGNGKTTIGEVLKACPRVSIPIQIGTHDVIPSFDTQVVSFLKEVQNRLV